MLSVSSFNQHCKENIITVRGKSDIPCPVCSGFLKVHGTCIRKVSVTAGYVFHTATGLKYTYTVHGGELFISRKEKSVTKASVEKAYRNVDGDSVRIYNRPKDLGDLFGISYIYPIFYRFGLIDVPEKVKGKMQG